MTTPSPEFTDKKFVAAVNKVEKLLGDLKYAIDSYAKLVELNGPEEYNVKELEGYAETLQTVRDKIRANVVD